jgi:hypothetical protein
METEDSSPLKQNPTTASSFFSAHISTISCIYWRDSPIVSEKK